MATGDAPSLEYDPTDLDWGGWLVDTFPPEVCEHFVMMTVVRRGVPPRPLDRLVDGPCTWMWTLVCGSWWLTTTTAGGGA